MKKYAIILISGLTALLFLAYVALDTFVIPRDYDIIGETAATESTNSPDESSGKSEERIETVPFENETTETRTFIPDTTIAEESAKAGATVTADSYSDGNITIKITTYREYNTDIYVADIVLADAAYLKTAFAAGKYGKNRTEETSVIASEVNAILAINGDYYGVQERGYVLRNGVLYRNTSKSNQEDLVIYRDGSFEIITETSVSANTLLNNGARQILSFGPGLLKNGTVSVTANQEVAKAMASNPRTAIGLIDGLHYVFVVADGRTFSSSGLTLYQLAQFMQGLGVKTAYNLDGGGSSTMVFNGTVINNPTGGTRTSDERKVSDIVYIGY